MIEAYKNIKGISSIARGGFSNFCKTRITVKLPDDLKRDLMGFYLKDIPDTVVITDSKFKQFNGWTGFIYFE